MLDTTKKRRTGKLESGTVDNRQKEAHREKCLETTGWNVKDSEKV